MSLHSVLRSIGILVSGVAFKGGASLTRGRGVAYLSVSPTFTLSVRASRILTASWSNRDRTANLSLVPEVPSRVLY